MNTLTTFVACDPAECFRAFTDARHLVAWVPGLQRADILSKARGLADEVHFEFAGFAYTLVYSYDLAKREVSWKPKLGAAEAVSGFARFDVTPSGGTQITYGLEHGQARTAADPANRSELVAAFVTWINERPR